MYTAWGGGAEGNRTPDLCSAIAALSHLSYSPARRALPLAVGAVAEAVTVPVLLQWCEVDDVISQGPEASIARFRNTRVDLIRYPGLGHFPMIEDPDLFGGDLSRWIAKVSRRRAN